jgi:hypothetical protein
MVTDKKGFRYAVRICKLCGLFLLPFLLLFISLDELEKKRSICLFKNIFGIECYGCGIAKAVISVMQLDFARAFNYNKLIVIVMPLIIYLWIKEIIKCIKILRK